MSRLFYRSILALLLLLPVMGVAFKHASPAQAQTMALTEEDYYDPTSTASVEIVSLIAQYQASHPGVRIRHTYVPQEALLTTMLRQAATHTLPDILVMDNPQVQDIASTGALADLTPYTKNWAQLGHYYKTSLSTATWKGKLYGLPLGSNCVAFFYNKKLLAAAGLAHPPVTWAELRTDAKKLTHGNVYGMFLNAQPGEGAAATFEPFFWSAGGVLPHVDSAAGRDTLTLETQLVKDGSVSKDALTPNYAFSEQFRAGNLAMVINGPWTIPADNAAKGLDYGITYIPRQHPSDHPSSWIGGEVWTLPASTPARQAAAWSFLQFTQSPVRIVHLDKVFGDLPAYAPATPAIVKSQPQLQIFVNILKDSKSRAEILGPNYPRVASTISTAVQAALSGSQSPQQALQAAQATINSFVTQ